MKVLVVENDELSARILAKKIDNWGYTAQVARTIGEARKLLERESFRLIVTEINLPGGSGIDLVRHVRGMRRPRYIYITILTDVTDTNILMEALEAGADDLLRKPLNVFEMRLRIKAAKRMLNMEDELREGGGTDSTTGLVNHESFRQFFRVIVSENRRTKATGALLFIHLDNYFDTRERLGYPASEQMMRVVAQALGELVRSADLVIRMSDDSFCLCLQNTDWPTCRIVADKTQARLHVTRLVYEGNDLRPQFTIEAVNFPDGDTTADAILESGPRHAYAPGAAAPRTVPDPRNDQRLGAPAAAPPAAPAIPSMGDLLHRAGIDIGSFSRLSEVEQRQVLQLAEQLDDAARQSEDPA